jgi:hypothetical protein
MRLETATVAPIGPSVGSREAVASMSYPSLSTTRTSSRENRHVPRRCLAGSTAPVASASSSIALTSVATSQAKPSRPNPQTG